MAIHFRDAAFAPLPQLTVSVPDGAIIGLIGEDNQGQRELLRVASGQEKALQGEVRFDAPARYIGAHDPLNLEGVSTLAIDHALSLCDPFARARAAFALEQLRRSGSSILIASHDIRWLSSFVDEIWWLHDGSLHAKGDPGEIVALFEQHLAERMRAWGAARQAPLPPSLRRGDGRAQLISIETLNAHGEPAMIIASGERMAVRVTVRFEAQVASPVIGIMIRTRIGSEVYGTNTELEQLALGPMNPSESLRVTFAFDCALCPQEYTITAASHDPNGVWHDWMEDAIAFAVSDSRYTAGVANLRATVTAEGA
jgi:lipopolysaccharide transport system ATP-binding protein